jgi:hypothetical protein
MAAVRNQNCVWQTSEFVELEGGGQNTVVRVKLIQICVTIMGAE